MEDWIHEGLPPPSSCAEVWLGGAEVRKVARNRLGDTHFLDCVAPEQNVYCPNERIMAWRPIEGEVPRYMEGLASDRVWAAMLAWYIGTPYDARAHAAAYPPF